jgi:phospholipase C
VFYTALNVLAAIRKFGHASTSKLFLKTSETIMVSAHLVSLLALAGAADAASSLGEVKHVVMMMLENRSFQHVGEAFHALSR